MAKGEKEIGDWIRTEERLSGGGQADLFIAYLKSDTKRQRPCVWKQLRNTNRVARFRKEIRAAYELKHEGILTPWGTGVGTGRGAPFYVTPFLRRGHLKSEHLQNLSPSGRLSFFAKICRALGYAHENGVVHRDIKPENILLSDEGAPLVADFGLCYFLGDDDGERATETWEQVGSRFYMAPEMAGGRADPASIKPAADVYSLGKLLYWMFSGGEIFDREKHREPRFDLTRREPRAAHSLVNQLLDKSIVERPEERFFQDGTQFAVAVESYVDILSREGHVLDLSVPQLCSYCRVGHYEVRVDPRWWEPTKYGLPESRPNRAVSISVRQPGSAFSERAARC